MVISDQRADSCGHVDTREELDYVSLAFRSAGTGCSLPLHFIEAAADVDRVAESWTLFHCARGVRRMRRRLWLQPFKASHNLRGDDNRHQRFAYPTAPRCNSQSRLRP